MDTTKKKRFGVMLNVDLHREFKTVCVVKGVDMQDVINELIAMYVETERAAAQQALTYKPFRTDAAQCQQCGECQTDTPF